MNPPLHIPGRLGAAVDAMARDMMQPEGMAVDFTLPAGEAALAAPGSISWQVFKNPVTLFVGGIAAVLLELAEPRVREGVWEHSSFRQDAMTRLQRTGLAAMVTVYGARGVAEKMIAGVVRMHGRVEGTTREGQPYRANDPDLLLWVQTTATFGFVGAWSMLVADLPDAAWDRAVAEAAPAARLYGVIDPPEDRAGMDRVFERFAPMLDANDVIMQFLQIMHDVEAFPAIARPLQRRLIKAAIALLPGDLRARIGLGGSEWHLSTLDRTIVTTAARVADRIVLPEAPPARACLRLGLPQDWLYRAEQRPG